MNKNDLNKILMSDELLEVKENRIEKLDCKNYKICSEVKTNFTQIVSNLNKKNKETNYILEENSKLIINKFYDLSDFEETINIYLNGYNSEIILNLSPISTGNQKYIINVFHNEQNTKSITNIHGITIDNNKIEIENNGIIKNNCKNSNLKQDNKIIVMNENNSVIKPNLYIDEYDVEASHGAYIGKFLKEDIFYLKTRGLSEKQANNLLIQGFLINDMDIEKEKVIELINKYWR